jgi:hypothetical protein
MTSHTYNSSTDFNVTVSDHGPGYNAPQKLGRKLWAPMWLMAIMAFPIALIIGIVRANEVASSGSDDTIASLLNVQTGIMFIGFASVLAAVSFAIARILGEFRKGGGEVQETVGKDVVTLKMPGTARIFILGVMMAMMAILIASIIHFVLAGQISSGSVSLASAEETFFVLEAVRRLGVAVYLVSITFGLATIVKVLRFQAIRVWELTQVSSS